MCMDARMNPSESCGKVEQDQNFRPSVAFRFVSCCGHDKRFEIKKESGGGVAGAAGRTAGRPSEGEDADSGRTEGECSQSSTGAVVKKN